MTSRFQDMYGPQVSQNSHSHLVLLTEGRLEVIITEANNKLVKVGVHVGHLCCRPGSPQCRDAASAALAAALFIHQIKAERCGCHSE